MIITEIIVKYEEKLTQSQLQELADDITDFILFDDPDWFLLSSSVVTDLSSL